FPVLGLSDRQLDREARAFAWSGFQHQATAQQLDAFVHARECAAGHPGFQEPYVKAAALILDLDAQHVHPEPDAKGSFGNPGMPGHVRESLLDDAVGGGFDLLAKTPLQAAVLEVDADSRLGTVAI